MENNIISLIKIYTLVKILYAVRNNQKFYDDDKYKGKIMFGKFITNFDSFHLFENKVRTILNYKENENKIGTIRFETFFNNQGKK